MVVERRLGIGARVFDRFYVPTMDVLDLAMKRLRGPSTICKSLWGWIDSMTNWAPWLCVSK